MLTAEDWGKIENIKWPGWFKRVLKELKATNNAPISCSRSAEAVNRLFLVMNAPYRFVEIGLHAETHEERYMSKLFKVRPRA